MKFQEIITEINNAFFRLESFMNGSISNYQYFGFNEAFTSLFSEAKKPENFTYNNCKLIGKYWDLIEQIRVDYDRSDFKYTEAYENENFCKDCDEIMYVNWDRIDEFMVFSTPDEIAEAERKFSITDILKAPTLPPQPIVESPFSVLEWATIFYYADETKLLTENRIISERMKEFMSKHQINTTFDNFKAKYYEAKKRINEKNDYPINKLELIIPFLKENYKQTVTKVENDIIILEENKPEY